MIGFSLDQWVILILVFILGLFFGMYFLASGKWKRRYRDEVRRREELEREHAAFRREAHERDSLRGAALKQPIVDRDRDGRPL